MASMASGAAEIFLARLSLFGIQQILMALRG
jgi:hypothetical protein